MQTVTRFTYLLVFVATLVATPTAVRADPTCPPLPRHKPPDRSTRVRAVIAALVPTVYVELGTTTDRQRVRRSTLSAPDRPPPTHGRLQVESDAEGRWEVGIMWDPVQLIRRSTEVTEAPAPTLRREQLRLDGICPTVAGGGDASFEARLERVVARQKRRSLEQLLD